MKKELTEIVVVIDESGSMGHVKDDTIGGFNTLIETNKGLPGDANITLVKFNHKVSKLYESEDISKVEPLNRQTYMPSGTTALLDAVGQTIDSVFEKIDSYPKEEIPNVIFCVLTDGHENSSRTYNNAEEIKGKIENMKKNFSWDFLFLGADQDAWATGRSFGIDQNIDYDSTDTGDTMRGLSHFTASVRMSKSSSSADYVDADYNYKHSFNMNADEMEKELKKFKSKKSKSKTKVKK